MFCHLFILSERTKGSYHEYEKCNKECVHCVAENSTPCKLVTKKDEHLNHDKFGWMLTESIKFNPPIESQSKNTKTLCAINLIHPSDPDIWILYQIRLNKIDNSWYGTYRLFQSNEFKEFDNLNALNSYLIKRGYNGRKLVESDFIKESV